MTKEFNKLDQTFNVAAEVVKEEKAEVIPKEKPDRLTKDDITKDYEYTRGNLYSIIEKGQEQLTVFLRLLKKVKCLEHMKLQGN